MNSHAYKAGYQAFIEGYTICANKYSNTSDTSQEYLEWLGAMNNTSTFNDAAREGHNAYLEGLTACPYTDEQFSKAEAWRYGWRSAQHTGTWAEGILRDNLARMLWLHKYSTKQ